jgi:hypothetical protein
MAELKTKLNDASVEAFLNSITDENKRQDSFTILQMMQEVTGAEPKMWGASIVGFGSYHYQYASGQEGDWMLTGFSPRKQNLTLYIMSGFEPHQAIMAKLGKHACGKGCLYIKKLKDVDLGVLRQLVAASVEHMKRANG